jgi:hypothetical protein
MLQQSKPWPIAHHRPPTGLARTRANTILIVRRGSRKWIFPVTTASQTLIFINRCKSYFHQQRIIEEKRFGWPHTTWRKALRCGTSKSSRTRAAFPHNVVSRTSSTSTIGCRSVPPHCLNSSTAGAQVRSPNTRTIYRHFYLGPGHYRRSRGCSCSRADWGLRSAMLCASTTRSRSRSP